MFTLKEAERRETLTRLEIRDGLHTAPAANDDSHRKARRLRRQRRDSAGVYQRPTGWSVALW